MSKVDHELNEEGVVVEEVRPKLRMPSLYKVLLLNDDYTPMDFVVKILQQFFAMDEQKAIQVMLQVHIEGKGTCGVYPRDIAETKVMQVNNYSRGSTYPLLCTMEEV